MKVNKRVYIVYRMAFINGLPSCTCKLRASLRENRGLGNNSLACSNSYHGYDPRYAGYTGPRSGRVCDYSDGPNIAKVEASPDIHQPLACGHFGALVKKRVDSRNTLRRGWRPWLVVSRGGEGRS
ncbi:hypothetical protein J6590_014444 [Homalodisca vitripennis]|nr:hypothetical protein J6590_014444 [Homalodisca vitripennis]